MFSRFHSMFRYAAIVAAPLILCWCSETQAQIESITFTRNSTLESMVNELEFRFGVAADAEAVFIDQLGATAAIFQNNDNIGQELFLEVAGPIDSIGLVSVGQILNFGDIFDETDFLNLGPQAAIGDEVYVGFNSGGNVGYFNVTFDSNISSIFYSSGMFASGGESLDVAAVPEPSTLLLFAIAGIAAMTRRQRTSS